MNLEATSSRSEEEHGYQSEDDLIVYGEPTNLGCDPGELPIGDAEETGMSQQTTGSYQGVNNSVGLISREERRKRRREWKERQRLDERQDDDDILFPELSDGEGDDNSPMEDTFASLQALLEEKATQQDSHSQHNEPAVAPNHPIRPTPRRENEIAAHSNTSQGDIDKTQKRKDRMREGPLSHPCLPEPSPPDFAMNNDDYEDHENGDRCLKNDTWTATRQDAITSVATKRNRYCTDISKTTKKRKGKKSITICDPPIRAPSCSPPISRNSTLRHPRSKKQRHRHSIDGCELNGTASSCANIPVTQNPRTIVGLRPTHWQRPNVAKNVQTRIFMSAELSAQHKKSRMNLLRTSCVDSRIDNTSTRRLVGAPLYQNDVADVLAKENISDSRQITTNIEDPDRVSITAERLRSMIYHPPTIPKPRLTEALSTQKENDEEPVRPVVAVNRPNYSSPPLPRRQSSSKNKGGAWTKRLAQIKSDETNNVMKLQHAGMCRHGVSFDLNDPRKKAKTYTDVTILSDRDSRGVALESLIFRLNAGAPSSCEGALITVSSFIHEHRPTNGNVGNSVARSNAWISFRHTTARNIGIAQGMHLRLYDAVLLPIRRSDSMKSTDDENDDEPRFVIICTQICERHPTGLNPVPWRNDPM